MGLELKYLPVSMGCKGMGLLGILPGIVKFYHDESSDPKKITLLAVTLACLILLTN